MQIARKTDKHEGICGHGLPCCPHNVIGEIIEGSPTANTNNLPSARLYDEVEHNCPHCGIGYVSTASSIVKVDGIGVARLGDRVTYPGGGGYITTASEDTNTS